MDTLMIENPEKLTDSSFKITIDGKDFEYEVSEEKDIDAVIDKLNKWIARGEDSLGGLYDYIKRTFKLVGPYTEPIPEDVEEPEEEPLVDIPSDTTNIEEPVENQLDIEVNIDEEDVTISMNDWSAKFHMLVDEDDFTDVLHENITDEMNLKDRTELIVNLVKVIEADDITDMYNLINLILDTGVDIVHSLDEEIEDTEPEEEPVDDINVETETDVEAEPEEIPEFEESVETSGNVLKEDENEFALYANDTETSDTEVPDEDKEYTLGELIKDPNLIQDLISLDLSLYELTSKEEKDKIYFIGGINNQGNKFSLSYSTKPPVELIDDFDKLKELPECLNNIEDLKTVYDYIDKLLNISYNMKISDLEDKDE